MESDPFGAQVKVAKGDSGMIDLLAAHDTHFSFGENLGAPDCDTPIEKFKWLPTRQPVAVELWNNAAPTGGSTYTTITTWHNKDRNLEWRGDTWYWTKDREFERFLELPQRRPWQSFELATSVGEDVRKLLRDAGWLQRGSIEISADAELYRRYIQESRGEFTVARDQYVRPNTGWFSDRTACYLASGRPALVQDTGWTAHLPSGGGLLAFSTLDEAAAGVESINTDYPRHAREALDVAREHFDARIVLPRLLEVACS